MSIIPLNPPLSPRNGHTLKVILPGRVSSPGPGKQNKEQSLGDQQDIQQRWLRRHTDLPVDVTVIAGSGSGELLEREEYKKLLRLIEYGEYDLVLTEDLGRIVRRTYAFIVCELCEDHDVRLIAINNHNVDTALRGWRDAAFFAAFFYEKDNRDKSDRLKERLRSRFLAGGALERRIFGYVDPPDGAKCDAERQRDAAAESIYQEWFRRLDEGATYEEIADWLNILGVRTGPYCVNNEWVGKMVCRCTHNPILKGLRRHNDRKTRRINATGKYVSEKADPEDLLTRHCPHLAFFEEDYFDRVTRTAKVNNSKFKPGKDGEDPRRGRPKKKTIWPGQHIFCGTCGRLYRYGGHGQNDHLLCRGAYEYRCWNAITVDGPKAAGKLSQAIVDELAGLPDFDADLLQRLEGEVHDLHNVHAKRIAEIDRELATVERRQENTAAGIAEYGPRRELQQQLDKLEAKQVLLWQDRRELLNMPQRKVLIPTAAEIRDLALEAFRNLAIESDEFSRLIRELISRIVVYPVRLVDRGHLVLRAQFLLNLVPLMPDAKHIQGMEQVLRRWLCVDLFDPPQREEFRASVMTEKTKSEGGQQRLNQHQIAAKLGITHTAVQRAAALQRKMDRLGVTDAYQIVTEPPGDYTKLRRHKHPRYRLEPLPFVELF